MDPHPIRLTVDDDLVRSRLTVFFRLLLAIPHLVWIGLWSIGALLAAIGNWFVVVFTGRSSPALHEFLGAYVRYSTHVSAYLLLAANPYPGFMGTAGSYPVDVEIDPPEDQNRWSAGFRLILAIPAILVATALVSAGGSFGGGRTGAYSGGVVATVAFLAWFACLVTARMPQGFRDLQAYALRYLAQTDGYVFLLTGRYPDSDVAEPRPLQAPPDRPIRIHADDDLRRSRLTTAFRLLLALPHIVWLLLWSVAALLAAIASWFATLVQGVTPSALHRFLGAYVRYGVHVSAFLFLVANPFPGFAGTAGSYPVDLWIPSPEPQDRRVTGFRAILAVPALLVAGAVQNLLVIAGFLGWFYALVTGRMPRGLRNLGAYVLRYSAQAYGYLYLLTDRYPYSGPAA